MRISITNITDKFKLKFERLFYTQGTEVTPQVDMSDRKW